MQAVGILSFGLVANLVPLMTFAATLPQIAAEWGLSATEAGWIGGVYFARYVVAVPIIALMAYVVTFAGNTWEVFAMRVWFVACISWALSLPGNLPLPNRPDEALRSRYTRWSVTRPALPAPSW